MKNFNWKDYFYFSKKESIIALIIVAIVGGITLSAIYIQPKDDENNYVTQKFNDELNDSVAILNNEKDSFKNPRNIASNNEINESALFSFDPNILDENGFKKLGLSDKNIHTILNYRNKGGKFYKPEDIRKIYGISEANADKLIPFIHIESTVHQYYSDNKNDHINNEQTYQKKKYSVIDINKATEDDWKSLPGIGDVLSKRIIKFRDSKGGFNSVDEVAKTYGLPDSTFNNIKPYLHISPNN